LASLGLVLGAACSGEDGDDGDGEVTGDVSIYDKFGIDPPPDDTPTFRFDGVASPYEDAAGCKAFDNPFPEVHSCSCDSCFDLQRQCDALEGCREISECGVAIGCSGANDCYLGPTAPDPKDPTKKGCVAVIDKWGNTGTATAIANLLGACTVEKGCRTAGEPLQ
jgi:hypothetical protein